MAITNHERVGKALELLKAGLGPFVDREIKAAVTANTLSLQKVRGFVDDPMLANKGIVEWDAAARRRHGVVVNLPDDVSLYDLAITCGTRRGEELVCGRSFLDGVHKISVGNIVLDVAAHSELLV